MHLVPLEVRYGGMVQLQDHYLDVELETLLLFVIALNLPGELCDAVHFAILGSEHGLDRALPLVELLKFLLSFGLFLA